MNELTRLIYKQLEKIDTNILNEDLPIKMVLAAVRIQTLKKKIKIIEKLDTQESIMQVGYLDKCIEAEKEYLMGIILKKKNIERILLKESKFKSIDLYLAHLVAKINNFNLLVWKVEKSNLSKETNNEIQLILEEDYSYLTQENNFNISLVIKNDSWIQRVFLVNEKENNCYLTENLEKVGKALFSLSQSIIGSNGTTILKKVIIGKAEHVYINNVIARSSIIYYSSREKN